MLRAEKNISARTNLSNANVIINRLCYNIDGSLHRFAGGTPVPAEAGSFRKGGISYEANRKSM